MHSDKNRHFEHATGEGDIKLDLYIFGPRCKLFIAMFRCSTRIQH